MRIKSHRRPLPALSRCPKCKAWCQPHCVCPNCGYYAGRQVETVTTE